MNEQQARERAERMADRASLNLGDDFRIVAEQLYYEGYMQAWRDVQ